MRRRTDPNHAPSEPRATGAVADRAHRREAHRTKSTPHAEREDAFETVAAALLSESDVDGGTGFGTNSGLRSGGRIFAMLVGGDLVVKLPADRCGEMVAAGTAQVFEVGQRSMREWVRIADVDETRWRQLAQEARGYVAG